MIALETTTADSCVTLSMILVLSHVSGESLNVILRDAYKDQKVRLLCPSASKPVHWKRGNRSIPVAGTRRFQTLKNEPRVLSISNASFKDTGIYRCFYQSQLIRTFEVSILSTPTVQAKNSFVQRKVSETVALECYNGNLPGARWTRNGLLAQNSHRVRAVRRGNMSQLIIQNVRADDSGTYVCSFYGSDLVLSATVTLEVLTPVVIQKPSDVIAYPGETVYLTCKSTGTPKPTISWKCSQKMLASDQVAWSQNTTRVGSGELTLYKTTPGVVLCTCASRNGQTKAKAKATAIFREAAFNVTLGRSERKTVALLFDASPLRLRETPERWSFRKDGAVLPESRYFAQRSHGPHSVLLLLKSIVFGDEGFYVARILNVEEEKIAQVTVKLNIRGWPEDPQDVNFTSSENTTHITLSLTWRNVYNFHRPTDTHYVTIIGYNFTDTKSLATSSILFSPDPNFKVQSKQQITFDRPTFRVPMKYGYGLEIQASNSYGNSSAVMATPFSTDSADMYNQTSFLLLEEPGIQYFLDLPSAEECSDFDLETVNEKVTDILWNNLLLVETDPTTMNITSHSKTLGDFVKYQATFSGRTFVEKLPLLKKLATAAQTTGGILPISTCTFTFNFKHSCQMVYLTKLDRNCIPTSNSYFVKGSLCFIFLTYLAYLFF